MDTNQNDAVVDSFMAQEVSRNLLRYACGQRMMCGCGRMLDCRSAVVWTWRGTQEFVACATCFDRVRGSSAESTAHFDGLASDVFDGRKLWPARAPEPKHAYDVIGYAGDANVYCPSCAAARWGNAVLQDDPDACVEDSEGNEVCPVFVSDCEESEYCGECASVIWESDVDFDPDPDGDNEEEEAK